MEQLPWPHSLTTAVPLYAWAATALVIMIGGLYMRVRLKASWLQRAARCAAQEAEELRKNPRAFTRDELLQYNGSNPSRPLLLSLKGRVLDVRTGEDYYGRGGPYRVMAGRDASRAFAMLSLKEEDAHDDLAGVDEEHLKVLDDWYDKLSEKYPTVGRIADYYTKPPRPAPAAVAREQSLES
jgi:membrane-associated progesterone receptor component